MRLAYDLNKNIERLRNNITKETPASEKIMLIRLDDIEKGIEEKAELTKEKYEKDIQRLKDVIAKQDNDVENLTQLNEDTRSILSLYTALMNITPYSGNDNVKIQNMKTIGYIVASYASKNLKEFEQIEVIEWMTKYKLLD